MLQLIYASKSADWGNQSTLTDGLNYDMVVLRDA
jgi:hypothetical protein